MTDYPTFQVTLFTIMSSTILAIHFKYFPVYDDKVTLYLDIYNEVTILSIGFCLYPFASEWVEG
jgi:septum formation topological specificity factor MinE